MNCPYCQKTITPPEFWEFFDCPHCQASLEVLDNQIKLLKEPQVVAEDFNENSEEDFLRNENQSGKDSWNHSETEEKKDYFQNSHQDLEEVEEVEEVEEEEILVTQTSLNHLPQKESSQEDFKNKSPQGEEKPLEDSNKNIPSKEIDESDNLSGSFSQNNVSQLDLSSKEDEDPLSKIADFGNTVQNKNLFSYELKISGIHSNEIKMQVLKILKYKQLKLDVSHIISQIKDSKITLKGLHAVQMWYLVKRLGELPLNIDWKQKSGLL